MSVSRHGQLTHSHRRLDRSTTGAGRSGVRWHRQLNAFHSHSCLYLEVGDGDAVGLHGGPAGQAWRRVWRRDRRVWERRINVASSESRRAAGGRRRVGSLLQGQLPVRQVQPSPLLGDLRQQSLGTPPCVRQQVAGRSAERRPLLEGLTTVHVFYLRKDALGSCLHMFTHTWYDICPVVMSVIRVSSHDDQALF